MSLYLAKLLVLIQLIAVIVSQPVHRTLTKRQNRSAAYTNKLLNLINTGRALSRALRSSDEIDPSALHPVEMGDDEEANGDYYDSEDTNDESNHMEPRVFGVSSLVDGDFQSIIDSGFGDADDEYLRKYRHSVYDDVSIADLLQASGSWDLPKVMHEQTAHGWVEPADDEYAGDDDY